MPEKIIDDDGNEREVFSAEEVTAREEVVKAEVNTKLAAKEAELLKVNEEFKRLGEKDHNFSSLRTQKEELEKKIEEINKNTDTKINEFKTSSAKETVDELLVNLSSGDEELKKKIDFQYKRLPEVPTTKAEIVKKMNEAYLLAVGTKTTNVINRALPTGGGYSPSVNSAPLTPEQVELGKKFGITDEDVKKFSK